MKLSMMRNVVQSPATSLSGLAILLIAAGNGLQAWQSGGVEAVDWNSVIVALFAAITGICARDGWTRSEDVQK